MKTGPTVSTPLAVLSPELKPARALKGFSSGLATGLVVSALVVAAFSFHAYRRQLGESLIQLGERFAARPQVQTQTISPAVDAVLPAPKIVSPAPRAELKATQAVTQAPALIPAPLPEKSQPQSFANAAKLQPAKLEVAKPATVTPPASDELAPKIAEAPANAPAILSTPSTVSLPTIAAVPDSNPNTVKPDAVHQPEPANQSNIHTEDSTAENAVSTSEMYFDIGKFKDQLQAHNATNKLAQLGFPANIIQKNRLWKNSYQVLVGPYGDDEAAAATHKDLMSYGFKPRAFERGSRDITLRSGLTIDGTPMPAGQCTISWESYVSDASVKFMHDNNVVATADGKWVKRSVKYPVDAYMYRKNGDGSRTLLEIRFAGMRQALVFGKSS
jgi:cell division septation protein DedD